MTMIVLGWCLVRRRLSGCAVRDWWFPAGCWRRGSGTRASTAAGAAEACAGPGRRARRPGAGREPALPARLRGHPLLGRPAGRHPELLGQLAVGALRQHQAGRPQDRPRILTGRPQHVYRVITRAARHHHPVIIGQDGRSNRTTPGRRLFCGMWLRRGRPPGAIVRAWCPRRNQRGRPVSKGSGMTRGDRRRNARRERLRAVLPRDGAVIGIDLAEDKQAIAVIDHDVRVLARKTVRVKAFRLGEALDWAAGRARAAGFAKVTVACEPTGPRWLQVQRMCAERGLPLVCIQPLMSHIAREQQDFTTHKTDEADCVLIARLAVELHCYIPEELDETWAHLRHLGRRRAQLITAATASAQRIRDFLSVAWPTVAETCARPLESVTWLAALQVVTSRCGADPGRLAAMGDEAFTALV